MLRVLCVTAALLAFAGAMADPALANPPPEVACPKPACPPCDVYTCDCRKPSDPPCPPKYANLRFTENWAPCLCKRWCEVGDWTDALKARSLTRGGFVWVNVGAQLRLRYESFNNIAFGAPADPDDGWLLGRLRAHADLHVGKHVRVFVEGIHADQWERELGPRGIDVNEADVLNAFVEVSGEIGRGVKAGARIGRQELQFGKQRLISPLDWANTRRTFQGAAAWAEWGFKRLDAFFVRPVIVDGDEVDEWNEDQSLWGLYFSNRVLTCLTWDVYALGLHRDVATYSGMKDEEDRYTIGVGAHGKFAGSRIDYSAEAGYQFGSFGDGDIAAGFFALELGWKPCVQCWDPRIAVGVDWAAGDTDPLDGDVGTFNQLFPLGHAYLGHADLIGRQNVIAANLNVTVKPVDKLTAKVWIHGFWRADEADAVYTAGGGVLRAPGGSDETYTGAELDLFLKYVLNRHIVLTGGWAHFFTGDFIEATGADEDVDLIYIGAQVTM